MSLSTVSATIVDPSGQVFANGTWQLIFKPTPNTPGLFTDGGVPFTTLFGGVLDATGSFSQAGVARNDTIAPAGSKWSLIVSPNANGQAYSIDLNINNGAFNASALINTIITNIVITATPIARAYKDNEVVPTPTDGSIYFDTSLNVLKIWDNIGGMWLSLTPNGANPSFNNVLIGGTLGVTGVATLPTITGPVTINAGGLPRLIVDNSNYVNVFSRIRPIQPDPNGLFDLGNDLALEAFGPADIHFTSQKVAATTTATLNIGANANVLISSVTIGDGISADGGSTGNNTSILSTHAGLIIGRDTSNEELVGVGNWSIVDGTHLSITCAKTHSGTTDVEQLGTGGVFGGYQLVFNTYSKAAQAIGVNPGFRVADTTGLLSMKIPIDVSLTNSFPNRAFQFMASITGLADPTNNANGDLRLRIASAAASFLVQDHSGTNLLTISDAGAASFTGAFFAGAISGASLASSGSISGSGNLFLNSGVMTALGYRPVTAGGSSLGSAALPFANVFLGNAATNNITLTGTATAARTQTFQDATGTVPVTIASGTSTLTANATLAGPSSQAAITTVATNTLTTDTIVWEYASAPGAGDALCHVSAYITAGNVNFVRANPTAASQNVTAIVINWRVVR